MQWQSVPVGDERQRRTGQQLLELMGAQDIAVKIGLPYSRPRPGAVQQWGLTHQQSPVLGEKTSSILPVTLLVSNTPELLSAGRRGDRKINWRTVKRGRCCHAGLALRWLPLTFQCHRGSSGSGKTPTGGHLDSRAEPPWSPRWWRSESERWQTLTPADKTQTHRQKCKRLLILSDWYYGHCFYSFFPLYLNFFFFFKDNLTLLNSPNKDWLSFS